MKNSYGVNVFARTTKEDVSTTSWRINYHEESIIFPHAISDVSSFRLESDLRRSDYITRIIMTNGQIFYSDIPIKNFKALVSSQSSIMIPNDCALGVFKKIRGEDAGMTSIVLNATEPERLPLHKIASIRQTYMGNYDRNSREYVVITDDTPVVKGWFSDTFVQYYLIESIEDIMKRIDILLEKPMQPPTSGLAPAPGQ